MKQVYPFPVRSLPIKIFSLIFFLFTILSGVTLHAQTKLYPAQHAARAEEGPVNTGFPVAEAAGSDKAKPSLHLKMSSWYTQDHVTAFIPRNWEGKEVVFDIYTADGKQIQKIIEHRAPASVNIFLGSMPAGMYQIRATCQKESGTTQVMHTGEI